MTPKSPPNRPPVNVLMNNKNVMVIEETVSDVSDDEPNKPNKGLSELSKQLRSLQSTNHDYAAQIDKLERKLKIMSDLKGVSVHDLKSALDSACQGEAYNELRLEVETLRAQLAIARVGRRQNNNSQSKAGLQQFDEAAAASNKIANFELRVGELEEVNESLRGQISKLYESLREEQANATRRLAAKHDEYMKDLQDKELAYRQEKEQLEQEHAVAVRTLQDELNSTSTMEAESYLLSQEKERVSALLIQVAEYAGMEIQLTKTRAKVSQLEEQLGRQEQTSQSMLQEQIDAMTLKLDSSKNRADAAEAKLIQANAKIRELEEQVANTFSLELKIASQKVQLQELMKHTATHEARSMETGAEMKQLQQRASDMERNLQHEMTKSTNLQAEVERLGFELKEQQDEMDALKKKREKDQLDHETMLQDITTASKKEVQAYEMRLLELQELINKEKSRVAELETEVAKAKDLEVQHVRLAADLRVAINNKTHLAEKEKKTREAHEETKTELNAISSQLREAEMKYKLEKDKARSLKKQLRSTENEANLRKQQFESRFEVQDGLLTDLQQQLSSLYTAFHMERGERKEEKKTQAVLQKYLGDADSTVAHQLHDKEESEQQTPSTLAVASAAAAGLHESANSSSFNYSFVAPEFPVTPGLPDWASPVQGTPVVSATPSPLPTARKIKQSPSNHTAGQDMADVGVAQGYLLEKTKFTGWKKRYYSLHGNLAAGLFSLSFSEGPGKPTKGTIEYIQTGVSRVQTSEDFSKQPFAFVLRVNPYDTKAPTLHLAASSSDDLYTWMSALSMATEGGTTERMSFGAGASAHQHPVGAQVIIVDLLNHPEYNGQCGIIMSRLKDDRQLVKIQTLNQKVKLSPANLEVFAFPPPESDDSVSAVSKDSSGMAA